MTTNHAPTRRLLIATMTAVLTFGAPAFSARAEFFNCVQYVQRVSPVALHGDAYEWWDAADGRYGRGSQPKSGSVMVFAKSPRLPLGHVAIVQKQLDNRTLLVDHANWSLFSGHRGRVEHAVRVIDVSLRNDWSQVKVWYHSLSDVGQTVYSLRGFVYPKTPHSHQHRR